jgi:hypothetical protein
MADEEEEVRNWSPPKPEKQEKVPLCLSCQNHETIEGTTQSKCLANTSGMVVVAWEKAIDNGTFQWPLNYDCTQLVECNGGYAQKETN